MGEEDKKSAAAAAAEAKKDAPAPAPEEKPKDEKPKEEKAKAEEKGKEGAGEEKAPPPPPPEEVVMRVYMHCEGCARKVKKSLKGFDGVEEVSADSKAHKVVVKGKKAAEDPMKVVARVQKKTGRKVELLSPMPPPKEEKKEEQEKKDEAEPPKSEEKKEAPPPVIAVVLKVHMHCEACAQEIKKRILKMKGVQSAEPDLKASQVTVKGVFEATKLAEYVHKRTGKHAAIVKTEPVAPAENAGGEGNAKDEKKAVDGGEKKDDKAEKKDGGGAGGEEKGKDKEKDGANAAGEEKDKDLAAATANLYMHYPRLGYTAGYGGAPGGYAYPTYPPQIFSDENPNACAVM